MNDMNFDSLKRVKTPREWLDKAAAIPETCVKRKAAFSIYRFAAAASVVLVGAAGILMYMFFGNYSAPVIPRESADESVYPSSAAADGTTAAAVPAETIAVLSTDAEGNTVIRYFAATEPTAAGTQPSRADETVTSSETQSATEVSDPTVPSTERVTKPTEAPKPTSPPQTEPPATQEPTGNLPMGDAFISAVATFPASMLHNNEVTDEPVYCAIYDHGKLVSQGKASAFVMSNGNVFAEYDTGIEAERGKEYNYIFFRKDMGASGWSGSPVFASGTISY